MQIPVTNSWSCLPASFAMACDIPFGALIDTIGHDGSDCPYGSADYKAGFHVQECIEAVHNLGWICSPIELFPRLTPAIGSDKVRDILFNSTKEGNWARFLQHLAGCQHGVLEGWRKYKDDVIIGHAVAWDGTHIYDPIGKVYSFAEHQQFNFYPRLLWKLIKLGEAI